MNAVNYQKVLERTIDQIVSLNKVPRLLLHSCCAPCSSYCIEYLSQYFEITIFYYNPNISPEDEYQKRVAEQQKLIREMPTKYPVHFLEGTYDPERFFAMAKGLEHVAEGGERCFKCYAMRLEEAAHAAKEGGYDYFTTTLTISPLKNAAKLNELGEHISGIYGVPYLFSDFKKKNGYKRSTELSAVYQLYRQNYCGCIFSKRDTKSDMETNRQHQDINR